MASTYTTGFGIEKIGSGEQDGTWGTTTNHNLDILDRIASYKAVAITTNADTATLTVREAEPGSGTENLQDGMYRVIKFTGTLDSTCTITIAPNTAPAWFIIENATSGSQSIILSQGSGANVTVQNGKNAIIYCDGAGSGAAVVDALADLQIGTLEVTGAAAIDGAATLASTLAVTGAVTGSSTIQGTTITATTAFVPDASDGAALGTTSLEFSDLYLADGAVIGFGDDQDVTLTHVADTGLLLSSTDQLQFGDSGTYIHQSADGVLDLVSDTEIEINATTIDINGAVDVSGAYTGGGLMTTGGNIVIPNAGNIGSASDTDAMAIASDGKVTFSQELIATSLDISGDVDIDGTTNLDAVDIDGAVQLDATLTVGANDQGYDVKFFGDTASRYVEWDSSADALNFSDNAKAVFGDDSDLSIYSGGSSGVITAPTNLRLYTADWGVSNAGASESMISAVQDGAVTLYYNGNPKLASTSGGVNVTGEMEADSLDIDGVSQFDGALTVGVDNQGYDVKFFGDTASAYMLWDTSTDDLILGGAAKLGVGETDPDTEIHAHNSSAGSALTLTGQSGYVNQVLFGSTANPTHGRVTYQWNTSNMSFATGNSSAAKMTVGSAEVVVNDPMNDIDFRVESDGNANMLFVDAGNNRVGIGTGSPSEVLHVYDAGGSDAEMVLETSTNSTGARIHLKSPNATGANYHTIGSFNATTSSWRIGSDGANNQIKFQTGSSNTTRMTISANGEVHKPLQPAFGAMVSSTISNVTGDATVYTVIFDSEHYDQGGDYNTSTGIFTAPVAGKYLFCANVSMSGLTSAMGQIQFRILTSHADDGAAIDEVDVTYSSGSSNGKSLSCIADMAASDTAKVTLYVSGDTKTVDIHPDVYSTFSGQLLA